MAKEVQKIYVEGDSSSGFIFGIILLIVFGFVFWYWGLPAIQNVQQGGIEIKVPENIQINVSNAPAPSN